MHVVNSCYYSPEWYCQTSDVIVAHMTTNRDKDPATKYEYASSAVTTILKNRRYRAAVKTVVHEASRTGFS